MTKRQNKGHEGKRREDFQPLPLDLIVEILEKLPSNSLMRFRCVSKQWSTIITRCRDFIESIVTRSLSQPPQKLPFFIFHHCEITQPFFTVSSSFSQSPTVSVPGVGNYQYVRGLICFSMLKSSLVTIYNPTTRQVLRLPEIQSPVGSYEHLAFFGYDPVMNEYKVLSTIFDIQESKQTFHVFTLRSPIMQQHWRQIQCNFDEETLMPSISVTVFIDGTIYFVANRIIQRDIYGQTVFLMSFDVRSERFDHVRAPETFSTSMRRTLVNYLGKLGCIYGNRDDTGILIMENAEKQEWSRINFWLPRYSLYCLPGNMYSFDGVTRAGEIIVVPSGCYSSKSIYAYYYNIKQNSFRRVEIQGTRPEKHRYRIDIFAIQDHVENTMWL